MTNSRTESVVVPAIDVQSSLIVIRSLGRKGIKTIAVSEDTTAPAFRSKYCDKTVRVPSPYDSLLSYKDALLSMASRSNVYAITPMREADVYVLSKYRSAFKKHITPLWPSTERLRNVHDRKRLFDIAEEANIPHPNSRLLDEVDDWRGRKIIKSRYAILADSYLDSVRADRSVEPPSTIYLESDHEPDVSNITDHMGHLPIVQDYVSGPVFSFRALFNRGEPVAYCQKIGKRDITYAGGASVYHEAVIEKRLEKLSLRLLNALEWHGPASVQFIKDEQSGEFQLLEINPRFWASLASDLVAGIDFPLVYWRMAHSDIQTVYSEYRTGIGSHYLGGEITHLLSVLRSDVPGVEPPSFSSALKRVLVSIIIDPRFDTLSKDDPYPFVYELFTKYLKNGLRLLWK